VETGIDLNQPDKLGRYPLTTVMKYGPSSSAKILFDAGASTDIKVHGGKRLFLHAARYGHTALLPLLFEKIDTLAKDQKILAQGLWIAVEHGRVEFAAAMLARGVPGTLAQADRIISRSRILKKHPEKSAALRALFSPE
jgi:ankyrin repeat protein